MKDILYSYLTVSPNSISYHTRMQAFRFHKLISFKHSFIYLSFYSQYFMHIQRYKFNTSSSLR